MLTFMFASETVPGLNRYFQLVSFPNDEFRDYVLTILTVNLIACFMVDRLMKFLFSPKILFASFEGTTSKDVFKLMRSFVFVGVLMYTFVGNSEGWDELLALEQNITANITETSEVNEPCVGAACDASNKTFHPVIDGIQDEF